MDYLRGLRKNKDQTPKEYLRLARAAETLACQLPDAPDNAGFSDIERKRNFFQAMPMDWQAKFIESNLRVDVESINDMCGYFERLQELHPFKDYVNNNNDANKSNHRARGKNNNRHNNNKKNKTNSNTSSNQNRSRNNNNTNNNNGGGQSQRIRNTDPCPLPNHGNHTWVECRASRYNNASRNTNASSSEANTTETTASQTSPRSSNTNTNEQNYFVVQEDTGTQEDDVESFFMGISSQLARLIKRLCLLKY